jgi:amino acid transporter
MPLLAILLSVLGLIPFIVCGLAALAPDPGTASRMLTALIAYAAVSLAFAGGVHWGFELQSRQQDPFVQRVRLGFGVLPPLVGWIALLLPLVVASWVSLVVLIAAYIGMVLAEHEAARRELLPPRYLWLRWSLTIVAVAMMITVLTLRLLGQTIVF